MIYNLAVIGILTAISVILICGIMEFLAEMATHAMSWWARHRRKRELVAHYVRWSMRRYYPEDKRFR